MNRGRPGIELKKEEINILFKIMEKTNRTYLELAQKIGVARYQLYNPMNNRSRCSDKSYTKIQRFLSRN